ncbi:MAG: YbaN family protein [Paraclostridium sp.]
MKIIYLTIGVISFVIGLIGVVLPIVPTTPFMLLTSFCLLKSSDKLNEKFMKTRFYEEYVKPFKEDRGMTLKTKLTIMIPVTIALGILYMLIDSTIMRVVIMILFAIKSVVFIKIKTLK